MEEALLRELQERDIEFYKINSDVSEAYIDQETSLYKNICNSENDNRPWVAVVSPLSNRKEQALNFIRLVCAAD
jgi:hypothetical protein